MTAAASIRDPFTEANPCMQTTSLKVFQLIVLVLGVSHNMGRH